MTASYFIKQKWFSKPNYIITDEDGRLIATANRHNWTTSKVATIHNDFDEEIFTIIKKSISLKSEYFLTRGDRQLYKIFRPSVFKSAIFVESIEASDAFVVHMSPWSSKLVINVMRQRSS